MLKTLISSENALVNSLLQALTFAVITAIVFVLMRIVISRGLKIIAKKTKTHLDNRLIRASSKPIGFLIIIIGLQYLVNAFSPFFSANMNKHIDGIFYLFIVIAISIWLMRLLAQFFQWYAEEIAIRTESNVDNEFIPLIVRLVKIVIGIITLIIILKHFNQDVQSLVVSLGVGSLALALAAQETLSNMIAGFVIMTDRPFRVGDRIELSDGKVGDVYQIGLRSTKLMTFDNNLVIVPNAEIVKERVVNRSYPDPLMRVKIDVGVSYQSNPEQIKRVLIDTFKDHPKILDNPEPKTYFLEFGDSSLNFMAIGYVENWKEQFTVADELRCEIIRRFRSEGIEIPFPQRDIWIRSAQSNKLPAGTASAN